MTIKSKSLQGSGSLLLCAIHVASVLADEPATASYSIVAEVGEFRNTRGLLGCRLFRSGDGFPEAGTDVVEVRVPIAGPKARCEFRNVPAGTYAVAVMHDENDNRKLDKNFLGIPTEGYGVSNNKTYAMSSPQWRESTFEVGAKDVVLTISLRY